MLPEPPRMRPWNHHNLRPFNAGTGSVSKFQLRRGDVLAMNAVPGISRRQPEPGAAGLNQGDANIGHRLRQAAGDNVTRGTRPDDDIVPTPSRPSRLQPPLLRDTPNVRPGFQHIGCAEAFCANADRLDGTRQKVNGFRTGGVASNSARLM